MNVVAIFMLGFGVWLVDSAVKKRNPITSLVDIVRDPSNARTNVQSANDTDDSQKVDYTAILSGQAGGVNGSTGTTSGVNDNLNGSSNGKASAGGSGAAAAIAYARAQIGKGYSQAQSERMGPNKFDCSGLTYMAWKSAGVTIGTWTGTQIKSGTAVSKENIRPGDLVFPSSGHVGIATSSGWPCTFVDSPTWGKKISERKVWAFHAARRIG